MRQFALYHKSANLLSHLKPSDVQILFSSWLLTTIVESKDINFSHVLFRNQRIALAERFSENRKLQQKPDKHLKQEQSGNI